MSVVKTYEEFLKQAEATTEVAGPTSHPSKNEPDQTQPTQTGSVDAELKSELQKQHPHNVEQTPEKRAYMADCDSCSKPKPLCKCAVDKAAENTAVTDHKTQGTEIESVADSLGKETNKSEDNVEDPGSAHPARTDNDSLDNRKYASDVLSKMSIKDLQSLEEKTADDLAAAITIYGTEEIKTAEVAATQAADLGGDQDSYNELVKWAGDQSVVDLMIHGELDKQAADDVVKREIATIIKSANHDADLVAEYIFSNSQKQANAVPAEMIDPAAGGGAPPAEMPPAEMPPAMPEMPAAPPMDPAAAGGDDIVGQLLALMEQMTPEQMEQLLAQVGGEPPAPPEAGGEEPPTEEPKEEPEGGEDGGMEVQAMLEEMSKTDPAKAERIRENVKLLGGPDGEKIAELKETLMFFKESTARSRAKAAKSGK